ncbi:hypothetical protein NA8A_18212 [Nitratireductor indicus C115]|uniref:Uncharacterized protein n=1 Tax=Nitratireductor indicus C115 TaxID=1231190 RepID=K2PI64_9HYPH|nr:hypothetical protein NA8A_18212 [Nitratireductor indicus C115]
MHAQNRQAHAVQLDLFEGAEAPMVNKRRSRRGPPKTFFGRRGRKGRAILTPAGRLTLDDAIARSGPPEQIACAQ